MRLHIPLLLLALLVAAGCSNRRTYRLTSEKFPPTPADQEVRLFVNEVREPHVKIAMVQTFSSRSRENDVVRDQLQELNDRARALGADAVVNVRVLRNRVDGYVVDERVPFRAYRQGRNELYFLRGTAIRFIDEEDFWNFDDPLATADTFTTMRDDEIPEVVEDTRGTEDLEIVPRGLAPSFTR